MDVEKDYNECCAKLDQLELTASKKRQFTAEQISFVSMQASEVCLATAAHGRRGLLTLKSCVRDLRKLDTQTAKQFVKIIEPIPGFTEIDNEPLSIRDAFFWLGIFTDVVNFSSQRNKEKFDVLDRAPEVYQTVANFHMGALLHHRSEIATSRSGLAKQLMSNIDSLNAAYEIERILFHQTQGRSQ